MLLGTGALSVMVSLGAGIHNEGTWAGLALKIAWGLLGIAILLNAIALHGEVAVADALVKRLREELLREDREGGRKSVVAHPAKIYEICERIGPLMMAAALAVLVIYAELR